MEDKNRKEEETIDIASLYRKKGSQLRKSMEDTKKAAKDDIRDKIVELDEKFPLLPQEQSDYLLSLKSSVNLPESLFPLSYFEKPRFRGKKEFFQRLATDILTYGTAKQRTTGIPFKTKEDFAEIFLENRSWWDCEEKDVLHAVKILLDNDLIFFISRKLYFESIELSANVVVVLSAAYEIIREDKTDAVSFKELIAKTKWNKNQLMDILQQIEKENLVILDEDYAYFPAFGDK